MSLRCRTIGLAILLALLGSSTARATDGVSLPAQWDPRWTHAGPDDYALTGGGLATLAFEATFLQGEQPALHWTGPILFDRAVRDVLRGSTAQTRDAAAVASWSILALDIAYPLFDVPYAWRRYGSALAWDLFWQDATAISLVSATDLALRDVIGRARPMVSDCLAAGGSASNCLGDNTEATRSFPGGHFAIATTAAVLVCTQHLAIHLYGSPWDALTCATALTVDAAVGTLRLVTDNHWASDILAGGALGFAFGWGVPVVMHLHAHAARSGPAPLAIAVPMPLSVHHGAGLGITGWF